MGKETRQVIRREANSGMKWSWACQVYLCGINEDIHIFLEREDAQNACDRHNENIVWERHDLKYLSAYLERAWPWQKFGEKTRLLPLLLLAIAIAGIWTMFYQKPWPPFDPRRLSSSTYSIRFRLNHVTPAADNAPITLLCNIHNVDTAAFLPILSNLHVRSWCSAGDLV